MKKTIALIIGALMLLSVIGAVSADPSDFNDAISYEIQQTGSLLDKFFDSVGLFSVSGDLTCCNACQPTESGTWTGSKTISCTDTGNGALIDIYYVNENGGWDPLREVQSPITLSCNSPTGTCAYECYTCNIDNDGSPTAGLDNCDTDQDCKDAADDAGLPDSSLYVCTSAGTCRQDCDVTWGDYTCTGEDSMVRTGSTPSGCADPNPQTIVCNDDQVCQDNSGDDATCEEKATNGGTTNGGGSGEEVCGNAKKEGTEQCDDGNDVDDDICKNDCTINTEKAQEPFLVHVAPAKYKILNDEPIQVQGVGAIRYDNVLELTYTLKNVGADMPEKWILEVQPEPRSVGEGGIIQSLIQPFSASTLSTQQVTCDSDFPQNVHRSFKIDKGETKEITFKWPIPDAEINDVGNTFLYPIIRKDCAVDLPESECIEDATTCESNNGCYQEPFCDGLEDVTYRSLETTQDTTGLVVGFAVADPQEGCVAPIKFEDAQSKQVTEGEEFAALVNSKSECCSVTEEGRELILVNEENYEKLFDNELYIGLSGFGANPSVCVDAAEDQEIDLDDDLFGDIDQQTLLIGAGILFAILLIAGMLGGRK